MSVAVAGGPRPSAEVKVDLTIDVLEDEWMLVPVLPAGTAVESVTVGGITVEVGESSFAVREF